MDEHLVDRIYEAAFIPEEWPNVLQSLSEISNSAAAALVVFDDRASPQFTATELIRPVLENFGANGGWEHSREVHLMFSMLPPAAFVYDADYFPEEALEANHFRLDLTRPLGIGGQVGSFVPMPTGEVVLFSFERWSRNDRPAADDLDRLNGFRPHLARAGVMAARLKLKRAEATVSALKAIGLPAAVLSAGRRVIAVNDLLEGLPSVFLPLAHGRLALADADANALLRDAIDAAQRDWGVVRSIAVPATEERPPLVVHVLPLRRAAHDVFSGGELLVAATMVSASALVPSPSMLNGLFDLSPAEARVAMALSSGKSLQAAALDQGIRSTTARSHLEAVFRKTGTHQQSELVALLKTVQPVRAPAASP